ncbi:MAG TPA: cell division protein [Sulfurimonas sp.]|nr:cell division protein [Sulfurimonas sp.]
MTDRPLFLSVVLLITIGIVLSYSLSSYIVILFNYNPFHFAMRQVLFGFISIIVMWGLSQADADKVLHPLGLSLFVVGMVLMMIMPFLPSFLVSEVGGAKRWIKIIGFSLAPVEFFKVGFVYFLAWSFTRKLNDHHSKLRLRDEFSRFMPYAFVFILVMFLIAFMQNDLGQVVVLGLTLAFLLFFAGSSFKFFLSLISLAFMSFIFFIATAEHRIIRIKSWWASIQGFILSFFPENIAEQLRISVREEPYQIGHSLNAIHNGGFFGTGLANGTFKLGFLSEVHTDFVLAGLAEEFGFFGVLFVTMIVIVILQRIFKVANRSDNHIYYLFSLGIGLLFAFTFLMNAYGISGLTPIKGISVPFLSYGGSSMLAASIGIGMVLMISKKMRKE